ncbi:MAG TPA: hypothetical protein VF306_11360 [Pirellulales bacterium]
MPQIYPHGTLVECPAWIAGQSDHRASLADPEQVGMSNLVSGAVGHYQSERFKRLLSQNIA